ncbi:MAG: hypothetical protein ABIO49_13155 [Dokdonella sp.]
MTTLRLMALVFFTKREAWLSVTFAKEIGRWRLVYDQNTVIPAAAN